MFEVKVLCDGYNHMYFEFETLEEAQNFAGVLFAHVDEKNTTGLHVTISYTKVYSKEEE